jgi:thioesterase domain-containing protein
LSAAELLDELRSLDVRVQVNGDRLQFNAPVGVLTAALRERIAGRKQEILDFLNSVSALERQQPAIVPLNPRGTRPPVFGVPGHNGDVFCYRALSAHLGADQPFFGLQPVGYDGAAQPMHDVPEVASYFARQIRATWPEGPVIIAGFCAGGGIALELACQLQESGHPVSMLALFASPFPKAYRFWSMLRIRLGNALERLRVHWRQLPSKTPGAMFRYALQRLRAVSDAKARLHAESEEAKADPLQSMRRNLEAITIEALKSYEPRRFPGRGVLFVPTDKWRRIGDNSGRWARSIGQYSECLGAEGCTGENILLEPHVRRTAAEFAARGV